MEDNYQEGCGRSKITSKKSILKVHTHDFEKFYAFVAFHIFNLWKGRWQMSFDGEI